MEFERNKSSIPEEPCQNIANDTDDITSKGIRVLPFDRCTDECQSSTKRHKKDNANGKDFSPNNSTGDSSPIRSTVVNKKMSKNSPKLTKGFSSFFVKKTVSEYALEDEEFMFIKEYINQNGTGPIDTDLTDMEVLSDVQQKIGAIEKEMKHKLSDMQMSKSLTFEELETIQDTLKEHGFNLNRLRDKETELNNTNTEKHKLLAKIVTARKQANEAACYWTKDDSVQAASWMYLTSLANMLLADYDNRSKQVQRNNIEDIIEIDIEDNTDIVEEDGGNNNVIEIEDDNNNQVTDTLKRGEEHSVKRSIPNRKYVEKKPAQKKVSLKDYKFYLHGAKKGESLADPAHGFTWINGQIRCTLCGNKPISTARSMARHAGSEKHKEAFAKKKKGGVKSYQRGIIMIDDGTRGDTMPDDIKQFRCAALFAAAKANISIKSLFGLKPFIEQYSKIDMGNDTDLTRTYLKGALEVLLQDLRTFLKVHCFDEYSIIMDGTPSFAAAECIIIRTVSRSYDIHEFVISLGLFKKSLNGSELASHVIDSIGKQVCLMLENMIGTHMDRAPTNTNAVKQIKIEYPGVNSSDNYCCSHGMSNVGKRMTEFPGTAKYAELFRKRFQKVIQYKGKARNYVKEIFGEQVKTSQGVRFFVKYEQIVQIAKHGPTKIMNDIIPHLHAKKWSEKSTMKIMKSFGDTNANSLADLGMATIELAVVSQAGKSLAEGCYIFEGDDPIILRARKVFERIEDNIGTNFGTNEESLRDAANSALELILKAREKVTAVWDEGLRLLDEGNIVLEREKENKQRLLNEKSRMTSRRSSTGRAITNTAARNATHETDIDNINQLIFDCDCVLRREKRNILSLKKAADDAKHIYMAWMEMYPHQTLDAIIAHAQVVMEKASQYYTQIFLEEGGAYYRLRHAANAVAMFDPTFLNGMSEADIVLKLFEMVDNLKFFNYTKHFKESFLKRLKKEIKDVVAEATLNGSLEDIKPSQKYITRMKLRIKRKQLRNDDGITWREDDAEYSRRIWEWWKTRVGKFPYHSLALRLIVLTQTSSCSVERVFSRLKLIREICGERLKEDITLFRILLQCNGDLGELLEQYNNGGDGTPSFRNYHDIFNQHADGSDSDSGNEFEENESDDNSDSEDE